MKPDYHVARINIGAIYQSLGEADQALAQYEAALPHLPNDKGLLNNYGALLGTVPCHNSNLRNVYLEYSGRHHGSSSGRGRVASPGAGDRSADGKLSSEPRGLLPR